MNEKEQKLEAELRELSSHEDENGGFPWTVTVPLSIALCPTAKCTSKCR
ncbi:class II lanthipeptide, LchA2/BrtA2 family [Listeria grayi]